LNNTMVVVHPVPQIPITGKRRPANHTSTSAATQAVEAVSPQRPASALSDGPD
jgi:hypothetical protein